MHGHPPRLEFPANGIESTSTSRSLSWGLSLSSRRIAASRNRSEIWRKPLASFTSSPRKARGSLRTSDENPARLSDQLTTSSKYLRKIRCNFAMFFGPPNSSARPRSKNAYALSWPVSPQTRRNAAQLGSPLAGFNPQRSAAGLLAAQSRARPPHWDLSRSIVENNPSKAGANPSSNASPPTCAPSFRTSGDSPRTTSGACASSIVPA